MTAFTSKLAIALMVGFFLGLQFSQWSNRFLASELHHQQQHLYDSFLIPSRLVGTTSSSSSSETTDIQIVHRREQRSRGPPPRMQEEDDDEAAAASTRSESSFTVASLLRKELEATKQQLNAHLAAEQRSIGSTYNNNNNNNNSAMDPQSSNTTVVLKPTFSGFQNFRQTGARPRVEAGKSQHELLLLETTNHPNEQTIVHFFPHKNYYAAAWLSSIQTFLKNKQIHLERLPHDFNPNLEAGTWVGVSTQTGYRTVDLMDFYVHHLSRYKGPDSVSPKFENNWNRFLNRLQEMQETYEKVPLNNPSGQKNGKVLAITPFHAGRDNHSKEDEKHLYLNLTVKSLARVFPNVVVTVCDEANYNYVMNESGLNEYLYDVLLVKNLTMGNVQNCIHLPALSSVQTREKIRDGSWTGFEFVYYTESDQPLHVRNIDEILKQTLKDDRTVITPHRSYPMALPEDLNVPEARKQAREFMTMTGTKTLHDIPDIRSTGCCFDRTTLLFSPANVSSPELELFRQYNTHAQAGGTCNPLRYKCHICKFIDRETQGPCPPVHV